MRSSVFLLFLCSLSVHASQYYAADGSTHDLDNCYHDCITSIAKEGPSFINSLITQAPKKQREGLYQRVLSYYFDSNNYSKFEGLYQYAPQENRWINNNYKAIKFNQNIERFNKTERLSAAINYMQSNPELVKDNYKIQEKLLELLVNKREKSDLSKSDQSGLRELNQQGSLNLKILIQDMLYYNEEPMDDLFEVISFEERSQFVCETAQEMNVTFDEFLTEDCYNIGECKERISDHVSTMKNIYKNYLSESCGDMTILGEINATRDNALELMVDFFPDDNKKEDHCYDCGIKQYGDYIADTRVIKEADKFFKITKMWTQGCNEDETYASFYNMERRAIKSLRKYDRLNITDAATKSDKCKIRIDAVNYKK